MTMPITINNSDPDSNSFNDVRVCNNDCDYHTEQTFIEKGEVLNITDTCFSMIHINIRSTSKHLNEFDIFNQSLRHEFDVIAFSETWLNDNSDRPCVAEGSCLG